MISGGSEIKSRGGSSRVRNKPCIGLQTPYEKLHGNLSEDADNSNKRLVAAVLKQTVRGVGGEVHVLCWGVYCNPNCMFACGCACA